MTAVSFRCRYRDTGDDDLSVFVDMAANFGKFEHSPPPWMGAPWGTGDVNPNGQLNYSVT